MPRDQVLTETRDERLDLCEFLEQLDADAWSVPSLCSGWTVHDVLAHLTTSTEGSLWDFVTGMIKARGDFERMGADQARERAAAFPPAVLIDRLRGTAGSADRAFGAGPLDPLVDVLVHGQDIARPLNRARPVPIHRAVPALQHVIDSIFYRAKKRLRGVRLIANDVNWSFGDGDAELCGPAVDLLLVATGRPDGLRHLTGAGVALVAERLTPSVRR
jgi:uncharacterized protein (TIGR03083 family)